MFRVMAFPFRAMDPSHVALVDFSWPSGDFQKFECLKSDRFTVRMEDFAKLIRRAESKDSVEISREGTDSLNVKLSNGYKREFELHLIESSQSSTPLPNLNFDAKFSTTEPAFDRILNDVSAVSNHISIDAYQGYESSFPAREIPARQQSLWRREDRKKQARAISCLLVQTRKANLPIA